MAGTALVTGASSGIGEETAKGLLAAGYIVYAGARRVDAMRSLEAEGARVLSLDVTDDASMTAAVDAILRACARGGASTSSSTMPAMALSARWRMCRWTRGGGSSRSTFSAWCA